MSVSSYFEKLQIEAFRAGVRPRTTASLDWFRKRLKPVSRLNRKKIKEDSALKTSSNPLPGRMYMYVYDPKTKAKLPYYDKFPLIIMVGPAPKGFYGINLHYLPPKLRALLMDNLYTVASDRRYDENTKLRISYDILKGASKYRYFKPTFKHYLNAHVNSQFLKIDSAEWDIALFLPTERFEKAKKSRVFADSRKAV